MGDAMKNYMEEFALAGLTIATYNVCKYFGVSKYSAVGVAFCFNLVGRCYMTLKTDKIKKNMIYQHELFEDQTGSVLIEKSEEEKYGYQK